MPERLGFIGCGRLGRALLKGWLEKGAIRAEDVTIASRRSAPQTAREIGGRPGTVQDVIDHSDIVVLAVKPYQAESVLRGASFSEETLLVSTVAGVPSGELADWALNARIVRTMPNVGCQIGLGATIAFGGPRSTEEDLTRVERLFSEVGLVETIENEAYFHGGTGLSGSGPAYVFVAIQAMADGGVAAGLSRDVALRLAVATVEGAAGLVRHTGLHPEHLKDAVASPGGTTIAGLRELESQGFRGALFDAVLAASQRSRELASEAN